MADVEISKRKKKKRKRRNKKRKTSEQMNPSAEGSMDAVKKEDNSEILEGSQVSEKSEVGASKFINDLGKEEDSGIRESLSDCVKKKRPKKRKRSRTRKGRDGIGAISNGKEGETTINEPNNTPAFLTDDSKRMKLSTDSVPLRNGTASAEKVVSGIAVEAMPATNAEKSKRNRRHRRRKRPKKPQSEVTITSDGKENGCLPVNEGVDSISKSEVSTPGNTVSVGAQNANEKEDNVDVKDLIKLKRNKRRRQKRLRRKNKPIEKLEKSSIVNLKDQGHPLQEAEISTEGKAPIEGVPTSDMSTPTTRVSSLHKQTGCETQNTNQSNSKLPELNEIYQSASSVNSMWTNSELKLKAGDTGLKISRDPFKHCFMPNFLKDPTFLEAVKEELQNLDFVLKNNDLYQFKQTLDLKSVSTPYISALRDFLYGDFLKWLREVTGIPLNDRVDMSSSKYEYTDMLLCHDDELEGRRIAYILYLVPPNWEASDGGTLELFNIDEHNQPKDVVKSLVPEWNSYGFFEVSPVSFHQVAEVVSKNKVRLSINGWFHGPPFERPPRFVEPLQPMLTPTHIEEDELYSWINPAYLEMDTQHKIRKTFRQQSEIQLKSFLCEEKYEELAKALKSTNLTWIHKGPANRYSYKVLEANQFPDIVSDCKKFLRSEAVFLILSQLTGLKLHKLAPPDSEPDSDDDTTKELCPRVSIDVRRWGHGNYTLIRDDDTSQKQCALDAVLSLNVPQNWTEKQGGFVSYIARDEDEELLTVMPQSNSFSVVYRDAETLKFTKYINASVTDVDSVRPFFHDIASVYQE